MKNFLRRIFGKKEIPNPKETPLSESDRKLLDALDEAGLWADGSWEEFEALMKAGKMNAGSKKNLKGIIDAELSFQKRLDDTFGKEIRELNARHMAKWEEINPSKPDAKKPTESNQKPKANIR